MWCFWSLDKGKLKCSLALVVEEKNTLAITIHVELAAYQAHEDKTTIFKWDQKSLLIINTTAALFLKKRKRYATKPNRREKDYPLHYKPADTLH